MSPEGSTEIVVRCSINTGVRQSLTTVTNLLTERTCRVLALPSGIVWLRKLALIQLDFNPPMIVLNGLKRSFSPPIIDNNTYP